MIKKLQVYVSPSFDPYENLAVERHLLDVADGESILLYLWQNRSTVVIGKNQNAYSECRTELLKSEGGNLARRLSGGGAVFHDLGNLNFTFLCASQNLDVPKNLEVIREACRLAGIETEVSGRNDLLAGGAKFSGNAFYHSKGRSYHHGTLLICADLERLGRYLTPPKAKLETKGIRSVRSRVINLCQLSPSLTCDAMRGYLVSAAEIVFGLKASLLKAPAREAIAAYAAQFADPTYLYGTPFPFSLSCTGRLPLGEVELLLSVKDGVIDDLRLYTDALDPSLADAIRGALLSLPLELPSIRAALCGVLDEADADAICAILLDQILS